MKKNILTGILLSSTLFSGYSFAQSSANNNLEATAKVVVSCSIIADNINFGVLSSPLVSQSSNSNMNVLYNNNASYKIDLAYGGIYGAGGSVNPNYDIAFNYSTGSYNYYYIYGKSNNNVGFFACGFAGSEVGKAYFSNATVAGIYGYSSTSWIVDTKKVCTSNGTATGTSPTGWVGAYNVSGKQPVGAAAYNYGVMAGAVNKNSVAYSISVPGDASKVWNLGNNSYTATGNGLNQSIPLNAKIIPGSSSSLFPAQDFYLDTVTATITY